MNAPSRWSCIWRSTPIIAVAVLSGACNSEESTQASSAAAPPLEGPLTTIEATPFVTLGIDESLPLDRVRDALFTRDGFVVANGGSFELMYFDHDGSLIRVVGREGAGPGEYRYLRDITPHGSGLVVWDPGWSRVTVLDSLGQFEASVRIPPFFRTDLIGATPDAVAFRRQDPDAPGEGDYDPTQVQLQLQLTTYAITSGEELLDTVLDAERAWAARRGRVNGSIPILFGGRDALAVAGKYLYIGDTRFSEVSRIEADGSFSDRWEVTDAALPPTVRESWIRMKKDSFNALFDARDAERAAPMVAVDRELVDHLTARNQLPLYARMLGTSDGALWVEGYSPPDGEFTTWTELGLNGARMAQLRVPRGAWVTDISKAAVLVRATDDMDRNIVYVYRRVPT